MSVVGIDFGNDTCYISVARQGGIESIANDYSLRATPSYVAFGEKQRTLGVAAKSGQMTNVKRTFFGFKRLLGRKFDDPHTQESEQLTAALFTKLKITAETALSAVVNDVVISVPSYFTDAERRALLDAARSPGSGAAGWKVVSGQDLPEQDQPSRNVIFVDAGHTTTQVSACSFNKGKLRMLASSSCAVGGRLFDEAICSYMAEDFKNRYKLDVRSNKKATLKLMTEAEKLKKLMSANQNSLPLNIECFMNDIDVKGAMDRATFLDLIAPQLKELEDTMKRVLESSALKKEEIYSVEIVGGSSRIPAIKTMIEEVYGHKSSTTLNADEAVSRGCALQCAILSPTFKVREFSVTDIQPYPIKLVWRGTKPEESGEMEVFKVNEGIPFSKMLTFFRSEAFVVTGEYSCDVPYPNKHIGDFEIMEVRPNAEGGHQKVKVKVRVNPNGIFSVVSASLVEKHEIEEEVPVDMEVETKEGETKVGAADAAKDQPTPEKEGEKMETEEAKKDDAAKDAAKPEVKTELRKKVVNKTIDLAVTARVTGALSRDRMESAVTEEVKMNTQDQNEADRLVAKNSVEEYIYEIRGKLCDELEEFILEDDRNSFSLKLEDLENWLYEDGEFAEKNEYQGKLSELKSTGEAVKRRKREWDERPAAMNQFGQCLQLAQKAVDSYKNGDEKFNHLDKAEVAKVEKAIGEKSDWFNRMASDISKLSKSQDPPVLASQFVQEKDAFWSMASGILNKAKPKVEPPPMPAKEEAAPADKAADGQPQQDATPNGEPAPPGKEMDQMDVE